jgi:hypothetical protein
MKTLCRSLLIFIFSFSFVLVTKAQDKDSVMIRSIYDRALTSNSSYENLHYLCKTIGGRICGSPQAAAAVEWAYQTLQQMDADTVYRQPVKVRNWNRGEKETASMVSAMYGSKELNVCALGGSVGTGTKGLYGKVIEVKSFEELAALNKTVAYGKIIFFNQPADPKFIYTFAAYGGVAGFRVHGAAEAAKYGASGVIVRSLTLANDQIPHTGIMRYEAGVDSIPAVAISTADADLLSSWLAADPQTNVWFRTTCQELNEADSYNVIAEIKGSNNPEEIIMVGGHIDAWDPGEGAHDDGGGTVQAMDVIQIFKAIGYKPKHTIRCVVFMDEEVAQRGGKVYAEAAKKNREKHVAAIETDRGVFTPTGFSIDADDKIVKKVQKWKELLLPYGIYILQKGGSGVDISFLKEQNIPLIALITDSQRYFDYQHAASDVFETINKRELQLGSASLAALIYLIDKYGL